jgi:hypothetical protein
MEPTRHDTFPFARFLDRPMAGMIHTIIGLMGAIATAPFCFGLLATPALLYPAAPFLLPAFIIFCCIFANGAIMVCYHLFAGKACTKNQPDAAPGKDDLPPSDPATQMTSPITSPESPQHPDPQPAPEPTDIPVQPPPVVITPEPAPKPQPASELGPAPKPEPTPEPEPAPGPEPTPIVQPPPTVPQSTVPEYFPAGAPPNSVLPPLPKHSPTDWLKEKYNNAHPLQRAHFQVPLAGGGTKDVYVMILQGPDLMADRARDDEAGPFERDNAGPNHKDYDVVTEAANPELGDGGCTAGVAWRQYRDPQGKIIPNGWRNTPHFQALQQAGKARLVPGNVYTNEGADYDADHGFQVLLHGLAPVNNGHQLFDDMRRLYENIGEETARLDANSIHVTGFGEANFGWNAMDCAQTAVQKTIEAYCGALQRAPAGTVNANPMYIVFGRYCARSVTFAANAWTGGDAAYRDALQGVKANPPTGTKLLV